MSKKSSGEAIGPDKDWEAESDLRTLINAEKIKKDKSRMSAAMKKAKEQRDALANVAKEGTKS